MLFLKWEIERERQLNLRLRKLGTARAFSMSLAKTFRYELERSLQDFLCRTSFRIGPIIDSIVSFGGNSVPKA